MGEEHILACGDHSVKKSKQNFFKKQNNTKGRIKMAENITHAEKAKMLYEQGFLCSQAVLAAFSEELGLSEENALKLGACFGGGMCKGEVCGACTGALLVLGLKYGQCIPGPEGRAQSNVVTVQFLEQFAAENGSYMCEDLLGCNIGTPEGAAFAKEHHLFGTLCPKMVFNAAQLAEDIMNGDTESTKCC